MDAVPTTAYLMLGERCLQECAFCAQARDSHADAAALSRVHWPQIARGELVRGVEAAHRTGRIRRACFQVTVGPDAVACAANAVEALSAESSVPICVSIAPRTLADVERLLAAGAERVTIALDAATPEVYRRTKTGSWERTLALLESAARAFPGHVGTHLIAGLGETEREMVLRIASFLDMGVRVALFAFTPVRGTPMEACPPPNLVAYRRVQAAHWLLAAGLVGVPQLRFDGAGCVASLGLQADDLANLLRGGDAFRTSGCPDCNRPYYNERPGGPLYNYPRPLTLAEAEREVASLIASLQP